MSNELTSIATGCVCTLRGTTCSSTRAASASPAAFSVDLLACRSVRVRKQQVSCRLNVSSGIDALDRTRTCKRSRTRRPRGGARGSSQRPRRTKEWAEGRHAPVGRSRDDLPWHQPPCVMSRGAGPHPGQTHWPEEGTAGHPAPGAPQVDCPRPTRLCGSQADDARPRRVPIVYPRGRTPPARRGPPRPLDLGKSLDRTAPNRSGEPTDQKVGGSSPSERADLPGRATSGPGL